MMQSGHVPHPVVNFPEAIRRLVNRFEASKHQQAPTRYGYRSTEAQIRNDFLDTFFEALGWDMRNQRSDPREVVVEQAIEGSLEKVDYSFRLNGKNKFFAEAKRPTITLTAGQNIQQIFEYSIKSNVRIVILTNFEEFAVYGWCNKPTKKRETAVLQFVPIGSLSHHKYEQRWSRIASIFSQPAVQQGHLDDIVRFIEQSDGDVDLFADPPQVPVRIPQAAHSGYHAAPSVPSSYPVPSPYQTQQVVPASYHGSSQSAGSTGSKVLPLALLGGLVLIMALGGIGALSWMWLTDRTSTDGNSSPLPGPTGIAADPGGIRCSLGPWDGAARAWDKGGSGMCKHPSAEAGYYLRVAHKLDKDDSQAEVMRAWSRYLEMYASGGCPRAKEMVFFDKNGDAGAGILFSQKPTGWDEVMQQESEWMLRDAREQPVTRPVCFFPAEESRRPPGWR